MIKLQGRQGVFPRARVAAILGLSGLLAGCASARLDHAMTLVGDPAGPQGFEAVRRDPLNARAHMWTAQGLLAQPGATSGDIELAKSGFRTAARLDASKAELTWAQPLRHSCQPGKTGQRREASGEAQCSTDDNC